MAPTTLSGESQVIHRTSFCCFLHCCGQVYQLIVLGATILDTIALDQLDVGIPLSCDGKVAGKASYWQKEVHSVSCYPDRLPFFLSTEETMKSQFLVMGGLALILVILLTIMSNQSVGAMSLQERVQKDLSNEKARFLPENSLDIAMAMKIITHDSPVLLSPAVPQPAQLLYPPSEETLARMSGP